MINTVHDYYLMPFLPLIYVVVSYGIHQLMQRNKLWQATVIVLCLVMPYFTMKTIQPYWQIEMSGFNNDFFKYRTALRAAAPADALCIMLNDHTNYIVPYQIDKRGYLFTGDQLPADWVADMINRFEAQYLYSDSRIVDENPAVAFYFDHLVVEKGSVRVYQLKSKSAITQ
ncbi:MAG: hypothetical protein HC892_20380 [Saprospiraceae bacterium]|nr:hypothetical protein [Saprospiraceae bacterium]